MREGEPSQEERLPNYIAAFEHFEKVSQEARQRLNDERSASAGIPLNNDIFPQRETGKIKAVVERVLVRFKR